MIVFGGRDIDLRNDVWAYSFDGRPRWDPIDARGDGPPLLINPVTIYDPSHDRMLVLFGIHGTTPNTDVWSLSLAGDPTWTRLELEGDSPASGTPVFDALRDRVLVVAAGGWPDSSRNGVYALTPSGENSATWSRFPDRAPVPPARSAYGVIMDPSRNRLVLFGGGRRRIAYFDDPYLPLNDVWAAGLDDTLDWEELAPAGDLPFPRMEAFAAYDSRRDRMVIWGGRTFGAIDGDAWTLSFGDTPMWRKAPADLGSDTPQRGSAIFDFDRDRLVIFGGIASTKSPFAPVVSVSSVRSLGLADEAAWETLYPDPPGPVPRSGHSLTFDPDERRFLLYGGEPAHDDGIWSLPVDGSCSLWREVTVVGESPPPRIFHSTVYDSKQRRLLVFGGLSQAIPRSSLNDVWSLSLRRRSSWTKLSPNGEAPPERYGHEAVFDPVGNRMIVYGGRAVDGDVGGVWELTLDSVPTWRLLETEGERPNPRLNASFVYDSIGKRAILIGGILSFPGGPPETWALDLTEPPKWERLIPSSVHALAKSAAFDPVANRVLAVDALGKSKLWSLILTPPIRLEEMVVSGEPPDSRKNAALAFDPERRELVLFGGDTGLTTSETWMLSLNDVVGHARLRTQGQAATLEPERVSLAAPTPNPSCEGTSFAYTLPSRERVTIVIYDLAGRLVRTIQDEETDPGLHQTQWDGRDRLGHPVPAGVYLGRMTVGDWQSSRKIVILPH